MEINTMHETNTLTSPSNFPVDDANTLNHQEIIIEEISRGQKLLHRHKINKGKVTIGRSYQNDIILTDPHICAKHITIELNNGLWKITDQQSVNGTFLENPKEKKKSANNHIIADGDIISLGKSQLRIIFANHLVAPTVSFSPFESFINLLRHPLALTLSIALFTLVAGTIFYLEKPTEVNFTQLLVPAIGMSLLFALWPGAVALVSHLTKHEARAVTQLGLSFAFFNLMWFSDLLENIVNFNSAKGTIFPIIIALLPIALVFCLLWLNSYVGFHMAAKRRIVISASITALLFGGGHLIQYSNKPEFNPRPQYDSTLMSPNFLLSSSSSVDEFIDDSSQLFAKANKAANKE